MLTLFFALLACGAPPDPVATFAEDPAAALAAIQAIDDPMERSLAYNAIISAYPGQSAALCPQLEPGPTRERCERYNQRPHLWTVGPSAPRASALAPPGDFKVPPGLLTRAAPDPGDCADADTACLVAAAHAAAAQGEAPVAAARCAALADDRARQDCAFSAAERVPPGPGQYAAGLSLCREAGSFADMCQGHVLLAMLATPAGPALAERARQAEEIRAVWTTLEPSVAPQALDRFWSVALAAPGLRAADIEEDRLPPEALPQLHNLAAEQAVGLPRLREGGLWKDYYPGEEQIPWVFGLDLGTGVRPRAADPTLDALLARLELEPRRGEAGQAALAEALQHPDPLVRWSAARLLKLAAPTHPALVAARASADPLVAARAAELPPAALGAP